MKIPNEFGPVRSDKSQSPERMSQPSSDKSKIQPISISKFEGNIEHAIQFYSSQVTKLIYDNSAIVKQLRASIQEKKELADIVAAYCEQQRSQPEDSKKRVRRCAKEIRRVYVCPVGGCEKSYGAEGSMAQHMKYKHPKYQSIEAIKEEEEVKDERLAGANILSINKR